MGYLTYIQMSLCLPQLECNVTRRADHPPLKREVPKVFSEKLSRSSAGGRLFLLVWVFLAALCVAVSLSMGSFARDAEARTKTFTGIITNSDPTQTGRLVRNNPPSTCANPTSFPGLFTTTPRHYDVYTLKNGKKKSCVTVTLSPTLAPSAPCPFFGLQSVAYRPSFTPGNVARNYVADIGATPNIGLSKSYSFNVPKKATFSVVVNEVNAGQGCGYTLKVSGISGKSKR
jgi:hypothetical protein